MQIENRWKVLIFVQIKIKTLFKTVIHDLIITVLYMATDRTSPCAIWEMRAVGACILGLVFFSGLSVFSAFSAFAGADRC